MVVRHYFQFVVPFLLVALVVYYLSSRAGIKRKKWHSAFILMVSACLAFIPFSGLSLAEYLLSFNPNFSIGSLALIIVLLIPYFFNRPIIEDKNLLSYCFWNIGLSLVVFFSYLGLVPFDLYALGYGFSSWFIFMAAVTLLLVWSGNPLSLVFLASIAAFNLKVLPSGNFFDYLTDGFLLILSVGVLVSHALEKSRFFTPLRSVQNDKYGLS
jgi:hypothetical protein